MSEAQTSPSRPGMAQGLLLSGLFLVCILGGILIGGYVAVNSVRSPGAVSVGPEGTPWRTNPNVGSETASGWLRAHVSQIGLLALTRAESVYYTARIDSDGKPLRREHRYRVSGPVPEVGWWSLSAYGGDYYLLPDEEGRYSVSSATSGSPEQVEAVLASTEPLDIALPGEGPLVLTLRLYEPGPWSEGDLAAVELPDIRRIEP